MVILVVGLSRRLLGPHTPHLGSLLRGAATIDAVTPAVTCTAQSTYLTGRLPREHGIVANGWYFRDLNEVWLWRQSNRLVEGPKLWHAARALDPDFRCASTFWWYNMASDVDVAVTPRPLYLADGRKLPDCASDPPELREELTAALGTFPLFRFWGPAADLSSTRWIAAAARHVELTRRPTLQLVYLPHLDYCLQQRGPSGEVAAEVAAVDRVVGELLALCDARKLRPVVLSEYGLTDVVGAVHPNRLLREAGLLAVKVDLGRETLDTARSRAFAVCDHQLAHVYVRRPEDVPAVAALLCGVAGVEQVWGRDGQAAVGLDHPRSGELVLLSAADRWFSYGWWLDDARAPDYARTVNIHAKPGYDPCELLIDPALRLPTLRIAAHLLKSRLGLRSLLELTPLDAGLVRGSHGRPTDDPEDGPLLLTGRPELLPGPRLAATAVHDVLLAHLRAG